MSIIEVNEAFVKANTEFNIGNGVVSVTPPLDDKYWVLRVPVSDNQSIIAFPKFFTYGIGFQYEDDWNTNLPYSCDTIEIFNHIAHNKGDDNIPDQLCIDAIKLIQAALDHEEA